MILKCTMTVIPSIDESGHQVIRQILDIKYEEGTGRKLKQDVMVTYCPKVRPEYSRIEHTEEEFVYNNHIRIITVDREI